MKASLYSNAKETVISFEVFKNMPLNNVMKAIEASRRKKKNAY